MRVEDIDELRPLTAIRLLELFVVVTVYGPSVMISPCFHVDALAARL